MALNLWRLLLIVVLYQREQLSGGNQNHALFQIINKTVPFSKSINKRTNANTILYDSYSCVLKNQDNNDIK